MTLLQEEKSPLLTLIELALALEGEEKTSMTLGAVSVELDVNLYRSKDLWIPPGSRGVFGGQVMGQSLIAAAQSVDPRHVVHSLHSTFLLPGDNSLPILYEVMHTRDGRNFASRTVLAKQRGKTIFSMVVSFQLPEEFELEHQVPMPLAPKPESVASDVDFIRKWLQDPRYKKIHPVLSSLLEQPEPIEIKRLNGMEGLYLKPKKQDPKQMLWIRAKGKLNDDHKLHQVYPESQYLFRADEWLLFEMESTRMSFNRALVFGRMYSPEGKLVVSCAQEGLIRLRSSSNL